MFTFSVKNKKSIKSNFNYVWLLMADIVVIFTITSSFLVYNLFYQDKIYPNTYVAGINLSGLTPFDASNKLENEYYLSDQFYVVSEGNKFTLETKDLITVININDSVNRAYNSVRTGNIFYDSYRRINLLARPQNLGVSLTINEQEMTNQLTKIADTVSSQPVYPSVSVSNNIASVDRGSKGSILDMDELRNRIGYTLSSGIDNSIHLPLTVVDPTLTDYQASLLKERAEKLIGKSINFNFEYSVFNYPDTTLLTFLDSKGGYNKKSINNLSLEIASKINREPQDPKFQFDGIKVTEFLPAADGILLDTESFNQKLITLLDSLESTETKVSEFEIPVIVAKPNIKTHEVNNLGIKELIGRGTSTYFHSIPGRVFNVDLAASKINGTLVAPGETFSFNQTLGDVSKFTGYKEAYVIIGGKTVLGDGGGVCQVSSTLFRAVLNTGLPIDERTGHAYRVGYYEQNSPPGMDATVYSPRPDFKFTNDTPAHILLVAKNDSKNYSLVFEVYGTSDGRVAEITKPVVSNYSPAPPTVYQDDPTLPQGTLKQIDFAASGARVTFDYSVKRNGEEIIQKTFITNYRPWAAVYLRGIKI